MCVCVCVRERERASQHISPSIVTPMLSHLQILDELEDDLDNMELDDIDTTDVNLDDDFLDD